MMWRLICRLWFGEWFFELVEFMMVLKWLRGLVTKKLMEVTMCLCLTSFVVLGDVQILIDLGNDGC